MIVVIVGHTLSGKTTLSNRLSDELGLNKIITYTNRPIREGEKDGVDYHYIDTKEIMKDEYFGKRFFYTAYQDEPFIYGMSLDDLALTNFQSGVIVSDPRGLREIKNELGFENVISIYVNIQPETLKARALHRGDKLEEVSRRLKKDYEDFVSAPYFADIVYGEDDSFDDLVEKLRGKI